MRQSICRPHLVLLLAGISVLGACHRSEEISKPAALVDTSRAHAAISAPAWLHDRLPTDTIGYLRVPSPLGMLAAPDGRMLDPLLADAAHIKIIEAIRAAIGTDPLLARTGMQPALKLLLDDLAAPLEVAIVGTGRVASPASQCLVVAQLRYNDIAALNAAVTGLVGGGVSLSKPFDGNGAGELSFSGSAAPALYDLAQHRLFVLAGMGVSAGALQALITQTAASHASALTPLEARIDQGGQGLLVWLDVEAFRSLAAMGLTDPAQKPIADLLQQVRGVALGWGTVDRHGHLGVIVDAPEAKALRYLPRSPKNTTLQTAGAPRWAAAMALPTPQEWRDLQAAISADFGAESAGALQTGMAQMKTAAGFDPGDILEALGPELDMLEDGAGSYAAIRLRDAAKFDALLGQLVKHAGAVHQTRQIGGVTFHSLEVPSFTATLAGADKSAAALAASPWLALPQRLASHMYWIERDGMLLFAKVPQILQDYLAAEKRVGLQNWLVKEQGIDAAQALFAATLRTRDSERGIYATYLSALQLVADASGAKIDLYSLPSANALALPREGTFGLQLHASRDDIGADLVFEQTPLELLNNGGIAGIAALGVVAAIALPAYQDYTGRAQVAAALGEADKLKPAIADYYAAHRSLPDDLDDLDTAGDQLNMEAIGNLDFVNGALLLTLGEGAGKSLVGRKLALAPYRGTQGRLLWQCGLAAPPEGAKALAGDSRTSTTIEAKNLPATCR